MKQDKFVHDLKEHSKVLSSFCVFLPIKKFLCFPHYQCTCGHPSLHACALID